MRKILLVASAIAIILVLALLLAQSSAETIPYSIKGTTGEIEFRHTLRWSSQQLITHKTMPFSTCSLPTSPAATNPGKKSR